MDEQPMLGTMKLVYAGYVNNLHVYSVQDVNWRAAGQDPPLWIHGQGTYRIGSPNAVTVLQQRMELEPG
jgi:hypothetical protein